MQFTWNAAKAATNLRKHGVSFEEAKSIFSNLFVFSRRDERHSEMEERTVSIGLSMKFRIVLVVTTELDRDEVRIISARKATTSEVGLYEQEIKKQTRP